MWVLLLSRRTDPPGTYVERRELESGQLVLGRRTDTCDWVIDDETGWISRQHAKFTVSGIDLFVTDTSTNGIALNGPDNRIASNTPVQVRVGDQLLLNDFVIEVGSQLGGVGARSMDEIRPPPPSQQPKLDQPDIWFGASAHWQDTGAAAIGGAHEFLGHPSSGPVLPGPAAHQGLFEGRHDFLNGDSRPQPAPAPPSFPGFNAASSPLDEAFRKPILAPFEPNSGMFDIPADWQAAASAPEPPIMFPAAQPAPAYFPEPPAFPAPPAAAGPAAPLQVRTAPPQAQRQPEPAPPAPPPPQAKPASDMSAAWEAFCEGAEISSAELGQADPETMRMLGSFYRQVVLGLSDLIRDRASFKDEFRVERTQLALGRNNPLKHLAPFEAAKLLLKPPVPGFLDTEEAIRTAFEDVKRHQIAMLAGVQHALRAVFERLSPATIEATVKKLDAGGRKGLFNRGADPWTTYQTIFQALRQEAGSSATSVMSVAFREGYEAFLRKY